MFNSISFSSRFTPLSRPSRQISHHLSNNGYQETWKPSVADSVHFGADNQAVREHNALTLAIKSNRLDQLHGHSRMEINSRDGKGWTPLTLASAMGHLQAIDLLCRDLGADVNLPESHGHTPLMVAIFKEQPKAVAALENKGANLQIKDKNGHTALQIARKLLEQSPQNSDRQTIVRYLESKDFKLIAPGYTVSALGLAAIRGDMDMAKHYQGQGERLHPDILKYVEKNYPDRASNVLMILEAQENQARKNNNHVHEVTGDAYPRDLGTITHLGYNELFADTGAQELDSKPVFELDAHQHPPRKVMPIEPDGFNLKEFQNQANQSEAKGAGKNNLFSLFRNRS